MRSIGIVFGPCGFGVETGTMPNFRCGLFRVWWSKASIFERLKQLQVALGELKQRVKDADLQ